MAGIEDVVVHPHGSKPERFSSDGELHQGLHILDAPVVEQRDADLHGIMLLYRVNETETCSGLMMDTLGLAVTVIPALRRSVAVRG
jgi:hypothetical protein